MFDIGFSEMLVIAVVALIVIGPERLPGVARTMGHLFGRMQRYVNDVKSDIQREIELDELRKLRDTVESSAREIEQSVSRDFQAVEREMHDLQALANPVASEQEQRPPAAAVQGERREQAAAGTPANEAPSEHPSSSPAAPPPAVPATSREQPRQA